jgi:hypothetical protein
MNNTVDDPGDPELMWEILKSPTGRRKSDINSAVYGRQRLEMKEHELASMRSYIDRKYYKPWEKL